MNKLAIIVCLFLVSSFLEAKSLFKEYKTKVLESNDKSVIIADSPNIVVGSSGIVSHVFDDKTTSIIARVDVVSKNGTQAVLKVEPFEMLTQGAFPETSMKPQVGDAVTINYLYDRALMVVPNHTVYADTIKTYNNISWVHPDIVAGFLTKLYRPNPDKEIFQKACYQNSASLIFFAIEKQGYFVDCHNFSTLKTVDIKNSDEIQLPFYSRITNIDSSMFSWGSSKIFDYNNYYKYLLGQTNILEESGSTILNIKLPFKVVESNNTLWQ